MGVRATGGGGPVTPVSAVNFLLCGGGEAPELTVEGPRLSHVWPRLRGGLCLWVRHAALWQGRVHRVAHGAVHVVRSGGKIRSPYLPPTPYTPPPIPSLEASRSGPKKERYKKSCRTLLRKSVAFEVLSFIFFKKITVTPIRLCFCYERVIYRNGQICIIIHLCIYLLIYLFMRGYI